MKRILMALISTIVLTSCSQEETIPQEEIIPYNYKFTGEGEYWEGEYSVNGKDEWGKEDGTLTYSNDSNYEFELTYKGTAKELSLIKNLEYSYETTAESGGGTMNFEEPPEELVVVRRRGGSGGGAKVSEDEVIQVSVKWDDFEESFELRNKED